MTFMKKFYITTSIPYVNSLPHVGNVLDSLYADVLARYKRQRGFDVRFLTGTDEHGVKIVRSAAAAGVPPEEFVRRNSASFRNLREILNLSWDDFIRTSDKQRHWPGAQKMWLAIQKNGDLYKKTYRGLYCVGHESFVTDKDLVAGKCRDHQKEPEIIEEENWFFKLSKYSKKIGDLIKSEKIKIVPETRKNEILSLIGGGLEDVSFSRPRKDLSWGVPVPDDDTQTMYVWADALVNYISALGYGSTSSLQGGFDEKLFKKYWPADVQVIGKDNLRFHAAIWLGMLLSAKLKLPKTIFVHGFINVEGQKISKTIGNIIDPAELVKKYGTDVVRYYLLRENSPYDDGDFSYEKLKERYNGDLANGLGNFAARVFALAAQLGEFNIDIKKDLDKSAIKKIQETRKNLDKKIEEFKFHEALMVIWDLISFGDRFLNEKKPWDKNKDVKEKIKEIFTLLVVLDNLVSFLFSFLPETSQKITGVIRWISKNTLRVEKTEAFFPRLS